MQPLNNIDDVGIILAAALTRRGVTEVTAKGREIFINGKPPYITHTDNEKRVEPSKVLSSLIDEQSPILPRWFSIIGHSSQSPANVCGIIYVERSPRECRESFVVHYGSTGPIDIDKAAQYITTVI